MMKRLYLLLLIVTLFIVSCKKAEKEVALPGYDAPDFSLEGLNGERVSLRDYKGKVVLLEFWATWCPPCRESTPEIEELYKEFKDEGFVVIGISVGESADTVRQFVNDFEILYPVALDDGHVSKVYGVISIPTFYLLDSNHKILKRYYGYYPELKNELSAQIKELLKKNV